MCIRDRMEKAFATYDIPCFMDHKKSILQNAFVEYVRSLLKMVEQNFTYESVFRFLRTGLTGFSNEEIDEKMCIRDRYSSCCSRRRKIFWSYIMP